MIKFVILVISNSKLCRVTHAGLTTRYRKKGCKNVFLYCQGHAIYTTFAIYYEVVYDVIRSLRRG